MNYVFTSGHVDAIPADPHDRRFVAIHTVKSDIPTELPIPTAGRMVAAYERAIEAGNNNLTAMRAAYRVLLDSLPS